MTGPSNVIAPQASMNLLKNRMAENAFRSTPKIACIAKHAISKTSIKTFAGLRLKAAVALTMGGCRCLFGLAENMGFYGVTVHLLRDDNTQYPTCIKYNPHAGAVGPAAARSLASSAFVISSICQRPEPTHDRLPTMLRTW